MSKKDISTKLDRVLTRLRIDTQYWAEPISLFRQKLEFLSQSNRHNKLLKNLFAQNQIDNFNSYVFETLFAYDFESKGHQLIYEVQQTSTEISTIDFSYETKSLPNFCFELRQVSQREWITQKIEAQLKQTPFYEVMLNCEHEREETFRLQNLILSKCLDAQGNPVKFFGVTSDTYNFIVVNISELHLGMVDKYDCILVVGGDPAVPQVCHRNVFGLCQELPQKSTEHEKALYAKFRYFRKNIHGVLFVKFARDSGSFKGLYIDKNLEYFLVGNNFLLNENELSLIIDILSPILNEWSMS